MHIRNLILAIYDQLIRPKALRHIFITHNAFGIFSRYSHIARQSRKPKIAYPSREAASQAATAMERKYGVHYSVYKCAWCDGWHIGKNRQNKIHTDPDTSSGWMSSIPSNRLYERLKAYPITDLAPVFDRGVRGRTMSGPKNLWLLNKVRDTGIRTVIDLRTHDHTDRFEQNVRNAGMDYLSVPIDKRHTDVHDIIAGLPGLFEILDRGDFYISCAMGLHRTDIALAIYYVFHPTVAYENVPEMRGHRVDGHFRCEDIAARLNSIIKAITPEELQMLELPEPYDTEFAHRKKKLFEVNRQF